MQWAYIPIHWQQFNAVYADSHVGTYSNFPWGSCTANTPAIQPHRRPYGAGMTFQIDSMNTNDWVKFSW